MPRRGLPETIAMRHDEHYVDALAASAGAPVGRMVPIDQIDPNPDQPRQVMGDLAELIAVIRDPIDRAYSNWTHLRADGLEPESDFLTACNREDQRAAAGADREEEDSIPF